MKSKKKECIYEYVSKNPNVGIMDCCKALGLPYKTVKKWRDAWFLENNTEPPTSRNRILDYLRTHPSTTYSQCSQEVGVSYDVARYWLNRYRGFLPATLCSSYESDEITYDPLLGEFDDIHSMEIHFHDIDIYTKNVDSKEDVNTIVEFINEAFHSANWSFNADGHFNLFIHGEKELIIKRIQEIQSTPLYEKYIAKIVLTEND